MKKSKKIAKVKRQILESLGDNRKKIINIEIKRSEYMKDRWTIRIGDIVGSTELLNMSMKKILEEIEYEMGCLK